MRLAGFVMSGAQNPSEVSKGDGAALLLWEAERGDLPDFFISLPPRCHASTAVSMPVQLFLCWYCRCQATPRVLEEDIRLL